MDLERQRRALEIVAAALEIEAERRDGYLGEACGPDTDLRREVEKLLAEDESPPPHHASSRSSGDVSDETRHQSRVSSPRLGAPPEQIGPYRILEKLGEGGMGEVWLAEQTEPVKRRVALKVIKHGMDTKEVVARFEAERQALAMMDHPCVARVFEAGSTPRGRPYFVMEYVPGIPITNHCDRLKLTNQERLKLFAEVCSGVQHAHQKAIIHRDLKPSNVLVSTKDGRATPKIIDFGVAKATGQKLTEHTMYTQLGVLIGTPEYMSPEQADMTAQDVDTRTDVYSLGVMLYELLVGALPFDSSELRNAGLEGIRRKIREEEPKKPSTRVSSLGDKSTESARRRKIEVGALQRQLRGDLDWITMKAVDKDRTRRYGSPADLAADIERHLRDEPVLASPPSATYLARKFVRRHRVGVMASAALVVVLIAGILGTTTGFVKARRAEADARREAHAAERVASFLEGMLGDIDPRRFGEALRDNLAERVTAEGGPDDAHAFGESLREVNLTDAAQQLLHEEILSRAAATVEDELGGEPLIAASLHHTLGVVYYKLGLLEQSEDHHRLAANIYQREGGDDDPDFLHNLADIATIYRKSDRFQEAEEILRTIGEVRRRTLGEEHPKTLESRIELGDAYRYQGRYEEAEEMLTPALADARRFLGDDHYQTLMAMNNLALAYREQGRFEESVAMFTEAAQRLRRVFGPRHVETLNTTMNLAGTLRRQGRYDEAAALGTDVVDAYRRIYGEEHWRTLNAVNDFALIREEQGRLEEAVTLVRGTLEKMERLNGPEHRDTIEAGENLSRLLRLQEERGEAGALQQ